MSEWTDRLNRMLELRALKERGSFCPLLEMELERLEDALRLFWPRPLPKPKPKGWLR